MLVALDPSHGQWVAQPWQVAGVFQACCCVAALAHAGFAVETMSTGLLAVLSEWHPAWCVWWFLGGGFGVFLLFGVQCAGCSAAISLASRPTSLVLGCSISAGHHVNAQAVTVVLGWILLVHHLQTKQRACRAAHMHSCF
jgi:hypothetical protein